MKHTGSRLMHPRVSSLTRRSIGVPSRRKSHPTSGKKTPEWPHHVNLAHFKTQADCEVFYVSLFQPVFCKRA